MKKNNANTRKVRQIFKKTSRNLCVGCDSSAALESDLTDHGK